MKFNYQARTKDGKVQAGVVEAPSKEAALTLLQRHGFYVTLLEAVEIRPFYTKRIKFFERISSKEIMIFSRQLAIMFNSRVPLAESLETLSRQTRNPIFKEKILKLAEEVEGGSSFSQALSHYPKIFSPFFISMVKSGEASGKLSESLTYLANHLERELNLRSKMLGAIIYPVFVLSMFLIVGAVMIFFIIPPLAQVLEQSVEELPVITKITLGMAAFLKAKGWILALVSIIFIFLVLRYSKTKEGKEISDRVSLKMPLVGNLFKKIYLARFAENLSTLIAGGLPIAQALEITGDVVGNVVYKRIIFSAKDDVRKGEAISAVLARYPETVPPLVTQMILVGERTGRLDTSLMNIVDFYQEDINRTLDSLISILEPVLIIFLGFMVGGLIISVFLPLYNFMGTF